MNFVYDQNSGEFDLVTTAQGGLDSGIGNGGRLGSLIWCALFSDGLVDPEEVPVELGTDRRGWWGDSGLVPSDQLARSKLWIFARSKANEATRLAIQNTAEDSLQPLIDDGFFSKIDVAVTFLPAPLEGVRIRLKSYEPAGAVRNWQADMLWAGVAG
jgi:phage gp46-like protein